jgi:hypothetical protein
VMFALEVGAAAHWADALLMMPLMGIVTSE